MLESSDFIAPVTAIVKKEAKKNDDVGSDRKDQRQKFVEVAYSTGAWFASSSDRPLIEISNQRTNKMSYSKMPDKQASNLPPTNDMTLGSNSGRYKTRSIRKQDIPDLRVAEPLNDGFAGAVDY